MCNREALFALQSSLSFFTLLDKSFIFFYDFSAIIDERQKDSVVYERETDKRREVIMKSIQSIHRAVTILEFLAENPQAQLKEITEHFQLSKSTIYSILMTLVDEKLVVKNPTTASYSISNKWGLLYETAKKNFPLEKLMEPYMQQLKELYDETVHLSVLKEDKVFYVAKKESSHPLRESSPVGTNDALWYAACGKLLMAFQDSNYQKTYLQKTLAQGGTPLNHEKNLQEFYKELDRIKKNHFAVDMGRLNNGVNCLAVPISNQRQEVVAALSIFVPVRRSSTEKLQKILESLTVISQEVSHLKEVF